MIRDSAASLDSEEGAAGDKEAEVWVPGGGDMGAKPDGWNLTAPQKQKEVMAGCGSEMGWRG